MKTIPLFLFHLQIFAGNIDQNTIVKHSLSPNIKAGFVRFSPAEYYNWPCLRLKYLC